MKMNQKKLKEILEDSDKLGPGTKIGSSRKLSKQETEALFEKSELQMISLRLPNDVVEKLKVMATKEGLKYQPYVRKLLIDHVSEKRQSLEDRISLLENKVAALSSKAS